MTTILQLRTGSCVKIYPMNPERPTGTTRDPTYAREQMNNRAQMPTIIRTSNTSTAPQANRNKRILRGDISQPQATKNTYIKTIQPRSIMSSGKADHEQIRARHEQRQVNARLRRKRIKAMWENKGCRTNTAPPSKKQTTNPRVNPHQRTPK